MDETKATCDPFTVCYPLMETRGVLPHGIHFRSVLNTFKTMITDDQVLVDDDLYILDRIQEFLRHPEVAISPASKNLQNIIERKVSH